MKSGIYTIINTVTKDCYIGSSLNIKERFRRHKKDLRKNGHHSYKLQNDWNLYGEKYFEFAVVLECEECYLIKYEQFFIDCEKSTYNICRNSSSTIGFKHSEESKDKIRNYFLENKIKPPDSTWKMKQKGVVAIDKILNIDVCEYDSISEACRQFGKDSTWSTMIAQVCNGIRKTAFGYKWRWTNTN